MKNIVFQSPYEKSVLSSQMFFWGIISNFKWYLDQEGDFKSEV